MILFWYKLSSTVGFTLILNILLTVQKRVSTLEALKRHPWSMLQENEYPQVIDIPLLITVKGKCLKSFHRVRYLKHYPFLPNVAIRFWIIKHTSTQMS